MAIVPRDLDHAIWMAVTDACQGRKDNYPPHATTWARGGYRNDVPTLCERCEALIDDLQKLVKESTSA